MTVKYSFFGDSAVSRVVRSTASNSIQTATILFASRGGCAKTVATQLAARVGTESVYSISEYAFDSIFAARKLILVIASAADSLPVDDGMLFFKLLEDLAQDFRVSRNALASLQVCVIGLGSIEYGIDNFCISARTMHNWLHDLGATCITPALLLTDTQELSTQTEFCAQQIASGFAFKTFSVGHKYTLAWDSSAPSDDEDVSDDDSASMDEIELEDAEGCGTEMLTSRQRKQLEKEGYKIIGSHSAVKLCRWTKHHTRGRGGCYKHTFYGISSMNCMEATPSLACANKCVFCWRHHKNPVGTSWKWKTDPADEIVAEAVRLHTQLIKQLKGVPGVTAETHASAMQVKHCALSLVGEPIMYPQINELLSELHKKRISTFLVTNAQFPEGIRTLLPVTQLYVSVDGATPESLKKTDRPLFKDFWERYIASFEAIRDKQQRTVYRLTLVKEFNMDEDQSILQQYADLVRIGEPDFIEIKAVTFCGASDTKDGLTMKNVPWHEEVVKFSAALTDLLPGYQLACEHKHSCSVLIALSKFHRDGMWHTWIDYEKYADLALSGRTDFTAEEYWAPTPAWAVYGADERGFDPEQVRHMHKSSKPAKTFSDSLP